MNSRCEFCDTRGHEAIQNVCTSCWFALNKPKHFRIVNESARFQLRAICEYRGAIRNIILGAKAGATRRLLDLIADWVLSDQTVIDWGNWADIIVPAPSSLWSRLRGNGDPAWHLASKISESCNRRLANSPLRLSWKIKKRLKARSDRPSVPEERFVIEESPILTSLELEGETASKIGKKNVLLVDDVVTTGNTLMTIRQALTEEGHSFRAVAFARAGLFLR